MSIAAVTAIGLADGGGISPVSSVRALDGRGTMLVRPVGTSRLVGDADAGAPIAPAERGRSREAVRGTAYQRNADGDTATFSSRLNSLTEAERAQLDKLRRRDQEVRTHEAAHKSAAGGLASGGPAYETQTGPDGADYAVGGHVKIDTSPGRTPEETIAKAQQIRQAALAPAEPSGQDLAVAAKASRMEAAARAEVARARSTQSASRARSEFSDRSPTESASQVSSAVGNRLDVFA